MTQSHGHAPTLDEGPQNTRTILNTLETRHNKLGRLLETKQHTPAHHVNVRAEFLTRVKDLAEARQLRKRQGKTTKMLATRVC
jgi:hypothetical protein